MRDVTATNASLEWVYDGVCVTAGIVTGYRVTYSTGDNRLQIEIPDVKSTSTLLQNLTPLTTYQVDIMVLTKNGRDSLPSKSVSLTTEEIGE